MYLKIVDESQLNLLKQINRYWGKKRLPREVLGLIHRILEQEKLRKQDYIAVFLKAVENDIVDIYDELLLYPDVVDEEMDKEDYYSSIFIKEKKSKYMWVCYKLNMKESGTVIYPIYCMKKKVLKKELSL